MALFEIGGHKKEIHTAGLSELCHTVAAASGIPVAPSKPITGANVFRHESGIHCDGLLKNKNSYQLFTPEQVGKKDCEYIIGYHSGSSAIAHVLEKQGISISRQMAKKLIPLVRETAIRQKSALSPLQLKGLHNSFQS
jgi:homocitrate synthase NifV